MNWFAAVLLAGGILPLAAADKMPPASAKQGVTFDKDIKPIFEASCVKCHGPEKQKGKLRLDTLDFARKTGQKHILPGKSAESRLVISVARLAQNEDENMPPAGKGEPLTAEQVGLIRAWIDQGTK